MDRTQAWSILTEHTKGESLLKHALAVEAAMRAVARKYGEDEEKFGIVGLLHDFDYEQWQDPKDHPEKGAAILRARGVPDDIVYAIRCHAEYLGLERRTRLDQAIYAVDELAGFVTAVALVRPSKSVLEVEVPSVRKKMKDKAFARNVSRDDIMKGAAGLGVELDELIALVIGALRGAARELGLAGPAGAPGGPAPGA